MSWLFSFVAGLAGKLLASLFGSKEPTAADLSAKAATAETKLSVQEANNAAISQADTARATADAASLRAVTGTSPVVDASANAALRAQFPGEFGDS